MRALARWGVTPLLAAPLGAHALGFGDIELQSALNQPFQAQIALVASADELQGLKVALAAPEVFERYGIDHPGYLSRFEFKVTTSGGRSVVRVSSREPVTEPFVTLLVEATWARGRRLREYTVLLDPPVLLPGQSTSQAVSPPATRSAAPNSGSGAINRPTPSVESSAPAPRPAEPAPSRAEPGPSPRPTQAPKSTPPPRELPTSAPGGSYGPVRRGEALWAIADRMHPQGVSVNKMMVAVYRANPHAFGGNMNVLHAGATLRLPDTADFEQLTASVATAEVQKQGDEWQNRAPQARTLRLLPPSDTQAAEPASPPAQAANRAPANASPSKPAASPPASAPASTSSSADENRRLLELRNEQLASLQNQAAAPAAPADKPAQAPEAEKPAAPGVELENEPLFADEASKQDKPAPASAETAPVAQAPAPAPAASAPRPAPAPSLVSQALGWLLSPIFLVAIGVAAVILGALLFVRRRRQEPEDVTGRWEALESEVAEDEARDTARLRRQVPEGSIVVEEGDRPGRMDEEAEEPAEPRRAAAAQRPARPAAPVADDTLSSQTVINLDQADPVAEADFHMAYGLYDQAAELVQKALDAAPNRRDLKLKLLEVFFVWGNKDAFLSAAQNLRKEVGQKADADWDKVVIMGKQICPDERLFAEATSSAGQVDVDLQAGDSPLDLAFDEVAEESVDLDLGATNVESFDLEATGGTPAPKAGAPKPAPKAAAPKSAAKSKPSELDGMLDIGERTAAGLETAFQDLDAEEDEASATSPDLSELSDSLAETQESPTVERPSQTNDWEKMSLEDTGEYSAPDAPTVETPTLESARPEATMAETRTLETAFRSDAPTTHTRTVETAFRPEQPTVEQPTLAGVDRADLTAEIDLDDLGLDVKDLEGLPHDLGDLPAASEHETDTREQPELGADDDLLSATGVTHVLHDEDVGAHEFETRKTAVLADDEATMLAPSVRDSTMTGTEVLEHRLELDETGSTSLVRTIRPAEKEGLDLNLDDFAQALHGADTVEQPRTATFSRDVFGGGDTPLDMDIGVDVAGSEDPTGTEEVSPLDPQTMTEVGTKLDLARAYIDMGDPEGARSILEEVLDEGDPGQRREAQGLIDVLSA
jgi:pilus assembly protein FimV